MKNENEIVEKANSMAKNYGTDRVQATGDAKLIQEAFAVAFSNGARWANGYTYDEVVSIINQVLELASKNTKSKAIIESIKNTQFEHLIK